MNGGLGVPSQLRTLNTLMVRMNRQNESKQQRNTSGDRSKRQGQTRQMSCDEALRFLSQASSVANVDEDFVTDQVVGRGEGEIHSHAPKRFV